MNHRRLRYFVAVAEQLNFTRAAEEIGVAQPALSQQIRKLETEVGLPLLERGRGPVTLTRYGEVFLPRARAVLRQTEHALQEVQALAGAERGTLRVGASGTIAAFLLPDLLAAHRRTYPDSLLHVVLRRSEAVLDYLEAGELEIGLIRLPFRRTSLAIRTLHTEPLFAALPASHPLAGRDELYLRELADDDVIMCVSKSEPFYDVVVNLCAEDGFEPHVIAEGAEYTTVFRLVGMNVGVSIVSASATRLRVEPSAAFVRVANEKATSPVVLVSEAYEALSPIARRFYDLVATSANASGNEPNESRNQVPRTSDTQPTQDPSPTRGP